MMRGLSLMLSCGMTEKYEGLLLTQSLEDDLDCGKLANFIPLTNYRVSLKSP
ncbi:hypothetical protein I3843_06G096700 [Carya illinoinensis]|nr:hypothetical protein I3843_06G096700 [Carya illinoinensis]